jgi:transketolase
MNMQNQREVYGRTLVELGKADPRIVVLEADLGKSTMTCYFEQAFPKRFFEMGIAEANMTSFAAGLSLTGKIPFTNSFAVFAAGRAYDQIRQGICIPGLNVKIVGSSAGLSDFGDGSTHQAIEDVAIMRAIPNLTVLVPMDGIEARKMTYAIAEYQGPVYLRLNRDDLPDLSSPDEPFVIGKPYLIREGTDMVIFANGLMVSKAVEAADTLVARDISVRVVNVSTLKPVDEAALQALAKGMKAMVTVEEHSIIGGLGSLIAEVFCGSGIPLKRMGVNDRFGQSAHSYAELLETYGLTSRHISAAVLELMHRTR